MRNFILVPASVSGIATIQCSSVRHLGVPGRSGPIAMPALFLLLLTLGNYTLRRGKRGQLFIPAGLGVGAAF